MEEAEPDIFYTDVRGFRNRECRSLGCDNEPLFQGRTPVQMYHDFIQEFADVFTDMLGALPRQEFLFPAFQVSVRYLPSHRFKKVSCY